MDQFSKLEILSEDSRYDLACSCGTEKDHRKRSKDGARWLYPVPLAAGGYGIMFKTLLSNCCRNDCAYCPLRNDANARRCTLSPDEAAKIFMDFNRKQWLLGLFLSSGVTGSADSTMERLTASAEILRRKYRYRGYIHLKIIPGASEAAMDAALKYASALSLNIEVPGKKHFEKLSSAKDFERDIVRPLKYMSLQTGGKDSPYKRVRCTTQFIVGASDETDREIIRYMDGIYNRLNFERIYFSAYQPGLGRASIPGERDSFSLAPEKRLTREHRLYQADWLIRKYRFSPGEMIFDSTGNLNLEMDPKQVWANTHPEYFPIDINTAEERALLRIPGLGPTSVSRIRQFRKIRTLHHLFEAGIIGFAARKALPYIRFS